MHTVSTDNGNVFDSPNWFRASTLRQRAISLRGAHVYRNRPLPNSDDYERLLAWGSENGLTTDTLMHDRLRAEGMDQQVLLYLFSEPIECVRARLGSSASWLHTLQCAFTRHASQGQLELPPALHSQPLAGFLVAIEPLIALGRKSLRRKIAHLAGSHDCVPFDVEPIEAMFYESLPAQLLMRLAGTFALELHVARYRGDLTGQTSAERFASFVERLRSSQDSLALLEEYPVLSQQLVLCVEQWKSSCFEFLQRLVADWPILCETFRTGEHDGDDLGKVERIAAGLGDRHHNGRSVLLAQFDSGIRVMYKPRSHAVDVHFQELLGWLNTRGMNPPLRALRVVDRGSYGWSEFVEASECGNSSEMERFYERQGAFLAVLHALGATDMYFGNVIASGEHPYMVDVESILQPRLRDETAGRASDDTWSTIGDSVMQTGMLPESFGLDSESDADLSGLSGGAGRVRLNATPHWDDSGTDEVRFTRRQDETLAGQNQPSRGDANWDAVRRRDAVVDGFQRAYMLLLEHRSELLATDGPLERFAGDEVRVIFHPTQTYGRLLQESFHPDVLRDALNRDRLLDRLWTGMRTAPHLRQLVPLEREDLQRGDIPRFTTRTNSTHLQSGHTTLPNFFGQPGLDRARQRVMELDKRDMETQTWLVETCLSPDCGSAERAHRIDDVAVRSELPPAPTAETPGADAFLSARTIGDRLERLARIQADSASWIGEEFDRERGWYFAPVGLDLYDGLPGIAMFLGYLGQVTGESRYTGLAHQAVAPLLRQVWDRDALPTSIGGFNGRGGLIYALSHLGSLGNCADMIRDATRISRTLRPAIDQYESLDVIGGTAGCLASLLSLHAVDDSARGMDIARRCGERLLGAAERQERGVAWQMPHTGGLPLAGFSHGAAGIGWALGELSAATGDERFLAAVDGAFEYERSLFAPEMMNWPDLRDGASDEAATKPSRFQTTWCHGAPGIGLARLGAQRRLGNAALRFEIDAALETNRRQGFGANHSLCHGDLGNLDLFHEASVTLNEPKWGAVAR